MTVQDIFDNPEEYGFRWVNGPKWEPDEYVDLGTTITFCERYGFHLYNNGKCMGCGESA